MKKNDGDNDVSELSNSKPKASPKKQGRSLTRFATNCHPIHARTDLVSNQEDWKWERSHGQNWNILVFILEEIKIMIVHHVI